MLTDSTISAHPLGGLNIEQETLRLFNNRNEIHHRFYALGELTKGVQFLTTDLGCVTAQARIIATHITESLYSAIPTFVCPL